MHLGQSTIFRYLYLSIFFLSPFYFYSLHTYFKQVSVLYTPYILKQARYFWFDAFALSYYFVTVSLQTSNRSEPKQKHMNGSAVHL